MEFLQVLITGLGQGCLYGLIALLLALVLFEDRDLEVTGWLAVSVTAALNRSPAPA